MLTGIQKDETASIELEDTTCQNWTSNNDASALLCNHNREGGGYDPTSWVNARASKACLSESMASGAGLFHCFTSIE